MSITYSQIQSSFIPGATRFRGYSNRIISIIIVVVFLFGIGNTCAGQGCKNIPSSFSNYEQAFKTVKSSSFNLKETVDTSKSSWIRGATYLSCDSRTGFLIINTGDREYIHQGVPLEVWRAFKNASSFGNYYNSNIRGKYRLKIE